MARNEEKHVARLNRLLLQQQREEDEKKNPKRPRLNTLNSAAEIQKWIPSIKKDIDFNLKQSQVTCYPDRKIEEFTREIDRLKGEYHAFVRKLREFDSSVKIVPWTERAYDVKKRPAVSLSSSTHNAKKTVCDSSVIHKDVEVKGQPETFNPIVTPILDREEQYGRLYGYQREPVKLVWSSPTEISDRPLDFKSICDISAGEDLQSKGQHSKPSAIFFHSEKLNATELSNQCLEFKPNCVSNSQASQEIHSIRTDDNPVNELPEDCSYKVIPHSGNCNSDTCGVKSEIKDLRTSTSQNMRQNIVAEYGSDSSDSEDSGNPLS